MKLFLGVFLVVALVQVTLAVNGIYSGKNSFNRFKKYLNREPPIDPAATFDDDETVQTKWIEQRLNNFDPQDDRVWDMRYLENSFFLQEGAPIFIYIGGEWTVSAGWLLTGHMHDMAANMSGLMIYSEHRYYGRSLPTPNLTNDNLRYLNIDQANADLAHLIVHLKQTNPLVANSRVFLVGGSYSATMATWFMQKYPHLADGAWSSSAPLLAQVDFVEYKEVVSEAFEVIGGTECARRIRSAFQIMEQLVADGEVARIEQAFHFCYPLNLTSQIDVWSFFSDMAGPFSGIVQYHREEFQDIQNECALLVDNDIEDDFDAFVFWMMGGEEDPGDFCYNHLWQSFVDLFSGTGWYDLAALFEIRQWYYQTCAEYGWYQSSGSDNILFGSNFPVELSLRICTDLYSGLFSPASVQRNVERTNVIYGGMEPNVRNVYSTHGQFDPWSAMGVHEDINESSPTVILPRETHCSDLYSMRDSDTPEMTASKLRIWNLARQWLGVDAAPDTEPETTMAASDD